MQGNGETNGRPQGVATTNPLQARDGWDREVQGFYIQTIRKQQHVFKLFPAKLILFLVTVHQKDVYL